MTFGKTRPRSTRVSQNVARPSGRHRRAGGPTGTPGSHAEDQSTHQGAAPSSAPQRPCRPCHPCHGSPEGQGYQSEQSPADDPEAGIRPGAEISFQNRNRHHRKTGEGSQMTQQIEPRLSGPLPLLSDFSQRLAPLSATQSQCCDSHHKRQAKNRGHLMKPIRPPSPIMS